MTIIMKEDIVTHRIKKCKQAMKDATTMLETGSYLSVANCLYYAAFYIVSAYFAQQNILVKSHKGMSVNIKSQLVSKNLLAEEDLTLYGQLMKRREDADYGDFLVISDDEANTLYAETKAFIQKIESLININE